MTDRAEQGIRGIVLAGVHRWDESSFEGAFPRPLAPVIGSPLICYVLRWLRHGGIERATICANSESRRVRRCVDDGAQIGLAIDYYEDWTPRGPAGCVRDAALLDDAELFVVADGTIVPQVDLGRLLDAHRKSGAALTIVVAQAADNAGSGNGHASPTGIYVFERRVVEMVMETGYQDIKEVLIPLLHRRGLRVLTYAAEGPCPRVTDAASYLAITEWLLEQLVAQAQPPAGYRVTDESCIHETAQVADGVEFVGPLLVGPDTRIEAGATIVGPTVIGERCTVRAKAVVSRSVLWDRCRVGSAAVLDRCILMHDNEAAPAGRLSNAVALFRRNQSGRFWRRVMPRWSPIGGAASEAPVY